MASGVGAWKLVLPASTATQQFRQTTFGTSDQVRDRAANRNGTGSTSMTTPCAADLRLRSLCFWPLSAPTRSNDTSGQSGERVSAPTSPPSWHGSTGPPGPVQHVGPVYHAPRTLFSFSGSIVPDRVARSSRAMTGECTVHPIGLNDTCIGVNGEVVNDS